VCENVLLPYFAANVLAFLQNGHCRSAPDGEKNAAGITIQRRAEHGKQQKAEYAKYGG